MEAVGARLFRHRGWVPVPLVLYALFAADPRLPVAVAGLVLMAAGEGLRLWGAAHLGRTARSSRPRAAKLVTSGPFAHTRHPLYLGNFALATGYALATGAGYPWFPAVVAAGFVGLYAGHARREEQALAAAHPGPYARYRAAVPALGWRWRGARVAGAGEVGAPGLRRALRVEGWTLHAEAWLLLALWARVRWAPLGEGQAPL